jgi:N-acetylglucosaminyl-diphospho-decaprenol L-rhamnosyltransferase
MASIDVVIINYNTCHHLQACLDSIDREAANKLVVVDNDSSDGSVEMVRSKYPWVTLYPNSTNNGYGPAANQAIAGCTAPYVLLLNSDVRLKPGTLEALSRYLDQHPGTAIVGPRLVNSDGTLQASCYPFPVPLDTFLENSTFAIFFGRLIRRYVPGIRGLYWRTWPHDSPRIVPWVKGAALAIRREAFNAVGGFDESFFMYFEDADLCRRMKKAGWEVHFAPVTTVVHIGGASTEQVRADMAAQLLHSTDLFYQRHSSRLGIAVMSVIVKSLMLSKWIGGILRLPFTRDAQRRSAIAHTIRRKQESAPWKQA